MPMHIIVTMITSFLCHFRMANSKIVMYRHAIILACTADAVLQYTLVITIGSILSTETCSLVLQCTLCSSTRCYWQHPLHTVKLCPLVLQCTLCFSSDRWSTLNNIARVHWRTREHVNLDSSCNKSCHFIGWNQVSKSLRKPTT